MNKKNNLILLLTEQMMAILLLSSCNAAEDSFKPVDESFFRLDVNTSALTFTGEEGATAEIKIMSTIDWRIECTDSHFHFSETSGMGDAVVTITANGNKTRELLVSSFKILSTNSVGRSFTYYIDMGQSPLILDMPGIKELASERGSKKWRWMPTNVNGGSVWGNGGYLAGEQDGSLNINGAWWGCGILDGLCEDKFDKTGSQHAGDRWPEVKGECYALSFMEFDKYGFLTVYSNDGTKINEGSFSIRNYNNNEITNEDTYSRGILETSEGAILWPFQINTRGFQPTQFEIGWLDPSRMVLIYAPKGTGGWGECTWWSFKSDDDPSGILTSHDWHWKPTVVNGGAVWGNAGYLAGSQDGAGAINGAWWGCGPIDGPCGDTFAGQMWHAGPAYMAGEEYMASKMVFNKEDSSITVYDKDGKKIRSGSFSLDWTPNPDNFSLGTLYTSEGSILWPFQINGDGFQPTNFDVGYLSEDTMILIYAPDGTGDWNECTWWSFGK